MEQPATIRKALSRIRWYRRINLVVLLASAPIYFVAYYYGSPSAANSAVIGGMLLSGVSASLWMKSRCPRCGNLVFPPGAHPFSSACRSCGLALKGKSLW
jgi:phosphate/sulfate permease